MCVYVRVLTCVFTGLADYVAFVLHWERKLDEKEGSKERALLPPRVGLFLVSLNILKNLEPRKFHYEFYAICVVLFYGQK